MGYRWLRWAVAAAAVLLSPGGASADPVRMLIGLSLPPYVIEAENRGIEFDIVKEALAGQGHRMVPVYVPFARLPVELDAGRADAAMTMDPKSGVKVCYSATHISYLDYAITLTAKGLRIDSVADLRGKAIRAFQTAREQLGPAYAAAVADNPAYSEAANQATQNGMLVAGRIDVVVADRLIFDWFNRTTIPDPAKRPAVTYHRIFAPLDYSVGFRDAALCRAFDAGLAALRRSGRYDAIVASYAER